MMSRRNFSLAAGMAAAVALTAGALIASTAQAAPDDATTLAPDFTGVTATFRALTNNKIKAGILMINAVF